MFAKLLKYEWKATAPTLGILSLAALGVGILGAAVLRAIIYCVMNSETDPAYALVMVGLLFLLLFLFLALIAYGFSLELILLYRFYKNKFTDEGYLTFTLPVTSGQIFLSSFVNIVIWVLISVVVVVSNIVIVALFGTATEGLVNTELLSALQEVFSEVSALSGLDMYLDTMTVLAMVQVPVYMIYGIMVAMTCITVGATISKRLKLLVAFGLYYGVSAVTSIITSLVGVFTTVAQLAYQEDVSIFLSNILQLIMEVFVIVGCYFLSTYLMRRKLNLP